MNEEKDKHHHHHHHDDDECEHEGGCCCHHHDEEEELTKGRLIFLICRLAVGLVLGLLGLLLWNEQVWFPSLWIGVASGQPFPADPGGPH